MRIACAASLDIHHTAEQRQTLGNAALQLPLSAPRSGGAARVRTSRACKAHRRWVLAPPSRLSTTFLVFRWLPGAGAAGER
ncbi:hypothetical protein [Rubritalea tangerina]|uniref:hypothetical protein n=1 Tax=Rubritalea tangerina TaxID=430798 RepID=UPI00361DCDAD